jgi:YhgE/Pip-like protein
VNIEDHRHEVPSPVLRSVSLWLVPVMTATFVLTSLAALYLSGSINSKDNVSDFPIAIVNEDRGVDLPTGNRLQVGDQIARSLEQNIDPQQFDVRSLSLSAAEDEMRDGKLYGALVLPSSLSADVASLSATATEAGDAATPKLIVLTNPRAGALTVQIVDQLGQRAAGEVNGALGKQLLAQASEGEQQLSGAAESRLALPLAVELEAFMPLPDGTGGGLSAFYYALILVLAGFTGSMIANAFVDYRLGFLPTEVGPFYRMAGPAGLTRTQTHAFKLALMGVIAAAVATTYLGVSAVFGMPVDNPVPLWLFSFLSIFAVAVVVQAINALLGSAGMLVNLFIFVILSMPSAGGTIPLEATPPFFRWLGTFEPMHQVYLGTRSILYYDATWSSGLTRAVIAAGLSIVLGVLVGFASAVLYDRRGLPRGPAPSHDSVTSGPAA